MASIAVERRPPSTEDADEAARLFAAYSERLFGYCLRQLGSPGEAEDAVQTTFVYALRGLKRGVVPECESAWLHAVAKNVCRWQRRTAARRNWLSSDVMLNDVAAAAPDDETERELRLELQEALDAIPERQRRALVLRELQGLPSREVATRLGMSANETYALLTRARHSLARALTAPARRPALSLNFAPLLLKVKALFVSGTANVVATTAVVAGIAVGGGIAVEQAIEDDSSRPSRAPATLVDRSVDAVARPSAVAAAASFRRTSDRAAAARRTSAARDDAGLGVRLPWGGPMPTSAAGDSSDTPGARSDPRSPDTVGSDATQPDSQPDASLVPGAVQLPVPLPAVGPPPELPGDVSRPPPVSGDPLPDDVLPDPGTPLPLPTTQIPGLP